MYKDSGYAGARHLSPGGFGQLRCGLPLKKAPSSPIVYIIALYYSNRFMRIAYAPSACLRTLSPSSVCATSGSGRIARLFSPASPPVASAVSVADTPPPPAKQDANYADLLVLAPLAALDIIKAPMLAGNIIHHKQTRLSKSAVISSPSLPCGKRPSS